MRMPTLIVKLTPEIAVPALVIPDLVLVVIVFIVSFSYEL